MNCDDAPDTKILKPFKHCGDQYVPLDGCFAESGKFIHVSEVSYIFSKIPVDADGVKDVLTNGSGETDGTMLFCKMEDNSIERISSTNLLNSARVSYTETRVHDTLDSTYNIVYPNVLQSFVTAWVRFKYNNQGILNNDEQKS